MADEKKQRKCVDFFLLDTEEGFDPNGDPKESYEKAMKHFERCESGIHPDLKKKANVTID